MYRERENEVKNIFFRDYSPPLLAPHPFRPLSRWVEVAERRRDRETEDTIKDGPT